MRTVMEAPENATHQGAWALRTLGPMAPCGGAVLRSWGSAAAGPLPTTCQWCPHSPFWRPKPSPGIADTPRGQSASGRARRAGGASGQEALGPWLARLGRSSWARRANPH